MGCDIHLYVEKRVEGNWKPADEWIQENEGTESDPDMRLIVPYEKRIYTGRNYDLFAILANVRNGRGFAGIPTGKGFNPIAEPKGLPDDCTAEVKQHSDEWGCDGHSHSWHTVQSLLEFDWTQRTRSCGCVNLENFERFDRYQRDAGKEPTEYCGAVSGPSVRHVSEDEMKALAGRLRSMANDSKAEFLRAHQNTYCQVWWSHTYSSTCSNFWSDTIPRLLQLGKPEVVRIVFWFDN